MLLKHSAYTFLYLRNFKMAKTMFFLNTENEDNSKIGDQMAVPGSSMALCDHTAFVTIYPDKYA